MELPDLATAEPFATLKIEGGASAALVVADGGGTFAQARIAVSEADVECFDVPNFVIARLSREPVVEWEPFGELVSDGGNAAFFSEEGLAEANAIEDEMWLWDKVDDARLPAAIALPSGAIAAYFSVGGDGSFAMSLGRDAQGAPAVFVIEVPELHLEG
jgi:hypothetical protein